jgi:hypothetical protein
MGISKSILFHIRSIKPFKTMLCCVKLVSETNTHKWFYTTMEECLNSIFGGWSGAGCPKFQNYFGDGGEMEGRWRGVQSFRITLPMGQSNGPLL